MLALGRLTALLLPLLPLCLPAVFGPPLPQTCSGSPEVLPPASWTQQLPCSPAASTWRGAQAGECAWEAPAQPHPGGQQPAADQPWQAADVAGEYVVRFTEYSMADQHHQRLRQHLQPSDSGRLWSWVERSNAASRFPTDFAVLRLAATHASALLARPASCRPGCSTAWQVHAGRLTWVPCNAGPAGAAAFREGRTPPAARDARPGLGGAQRRHAPLQRLCVRGGWGRRAPA